MATGLDAIDEIDLSTLTPEGKPKKPSRLSSASAIRAMYRQGVQDDQGSSTVRAQLQACKDGAPPFNQAALVTSGQGSRANFNTLMMQDLITKANTGRNDIIFSPKQLMTIEVEGGEPAERLGYCRIIAAELSRTIRKWGSFSANTQRLIDLFDTHGVGIDYAPDDKDFRFEVASLDEFLVPRQVSVSAEKTPWAIASKPMLVTELYDHIENEAVATKLGWNVPAVKEAIGRATNQVPTGEVGDTAMLQQQVKNNDVFVGTMFQHIKVLHCWVREFDSTYSLFITEKDAPKGDFLFKQYSRYESVEEAFNYFCYGVGNGKLHSVRGLGHMIFALCQMHSRLMCQKADGVMLSESIMLQATSSNAMQEATLTYLGPFSLMPQGFEVVEKQFAGGSDRAMGFLGELKSQMGQISGRFMTPQGQGGETYQNRDSVGADLENAASGDSGSIDLFYASWDRTMRRMCKRICTGPKSDPLVREFHRRIERAGITKEILDSIDHDSTYAYRTLGAGSPAARSLSFTKLMSLLPQLDEIGRKNLIYQFVANEVGYQNADEFASKAEEPRLGTEASLAKIENELLRMGRPLEVLSYQMHGTHVQIHVPPLLETLDAVERGELDPMQELPGLQATLDHLSAHGEELVRDPSQLALYGQVKEAINNTQQVVTNMERKIKAIQAQGGGAEGEGQPAPGGEDAMNAEKVKQEQLKTAMIEFKFDLAQRKGEMELAMQQAKADQNLALNDLKGAEMVQKKMQYPRSDYSNRR